MIYYSWVLGKGTEFSIVSSSSSMLEEPLYVSEGKGRFSVEDVCGLPFNQQKPSHWNKCLMASCSSLQVHLA
jgi:hypothetical protein